MAGAVKRLIDRIIEERARGNRVLVTTTRTKLLLKGIDPDSYTETSEDDHRVVLELMTIAKELGVNV